MVHGDGGGRRRVLIGALASLVLVVVGVFCLDSSLVTKLRRPTSSHLLSTPATLSNTTIVPITANSTHSFDGTVQATSPLQYAGLNTSGDATSAPTTVPVTAEPKSSLTSNVMATTPAPDPTTATAPVFAAVPPDSRRLAYMLYATDARTVCNALLMARNIRATGTPVSIPIVTLIANDVAPDVVTRLVDTANNFVVEMVAPWQQSRVHLSHEYASSLTKLRIFQARPYDKIIYLDSDAWIQRNLDHLFHLGDAVFWAPHAYYISENYVFGSTLLVFSPSDDVFAALERALEAPPRANYFDMDVLNDLYRLQCGYLPRHYVVLSYTLNDAAAWSFQSKAERMATTYVYHYSPGLGVGKPWQTPRSILDNKNPAYDPLFYDLFARYWAQEDALCSWLRQ